jgi:hypothetical protein
MKKTFEAFDVVQDLASADFWIQKLKLASCVEITVTEQYSFTF